MRNSAILIAFLVSCLVVATHNDARANETVFLDSMGGNWMGTGIVKVNTSVPAVNVNCDFNSVAQSGQFDLNGTCAAFLVVRKIVAAKLTVFEGQYLGEYIGARSGTASLSGARSGNEIRLNIGWAGMVNGDQEASMLIRKNSTDNLELIISDTDPKTGLRQITSHLNLTRK